MLKLLPGRMVAPSCLILGKSLTSTENMEKDSATAFFPCHNKTLAPVYFGFSEHHQVTNLGQKAQPRTCVETAGQPALHLEVAQQQGEGLSCRKPKSNSCSFF